MSTSFNMVPLEVNEMIALNIGNDKDLANFRLICRQTKHAIDGNNGSFWRKRFHQGYDAKAPIVSNSRTLVNNNYRIMYQRRRHYLKHGCTFDRAGITSTELRCLDILRDLIIDSFAGAIDGISKNLAAIRRFLESFDLIRTIKTSRSNPGARTQLSRGLYNTIVVVLTHLTLELDSRGIAKSICFRFPESQQTMYAPDAYCPIFTGISGLEINMEWCLQAANFWKYHLTRQEEMTLYDDFKALTSGERPKGWNKKLASGTHKLGKNWRGAYAFLHHDEIADVRAGLNAEEGSIQDHLNTEENDKGFQSLTLSFPSLDEGLATWPTLFENHLSSLSPPTVSTDPRVTTRAQHRQNTANNSPNSDGNGGDGTFRPGHGNRYTAPITTEPIPFTASGTDNTETFNGSGWLNAMPAQQGIPGWQRLTMMKYYIDEWGCRDDNALWAYEGVVLPGGMIVLGRWWSPGGRGLEQYCGPFVLWNVDDEAQ